MKGFDLEIEKDFYQLVKERAESQGITISEQFEIMINRGVTVYWTRRQYRKLSDSKAVDICNSIRISKIKLERKDDSFEVKLEKYEGKRDMIEILRSKKPDKDSMDMVIHLEDGLIDYLENESIEAGVSPSHLIKHHIEEALTVEERHRNKNTSQKELEVLDEIMKSSVKMDKKNGEVKIKGKDGTIHDSEYWFISLI